MTQGNPMIICADALEWLPDRNRTASIVTSLPDAAELSMRIPEWRKWFRNAAALCMATASHHAPSVFYQTDRKAARTWHSKAGLLMEAADKANVRLLWHKIVLRHAVGATDLHRPGYTHLMAFSRAAGPGMASPDVMQAGPAAYPNGMGLNAARFAVDFAACYSASLIDPFCGRGTIPACSAAAGLAAIGVDIDETQCEYARRLCEGGLAGMIMTQPQPQLL